MLWLKTCGSTQDELLALALNGGAQLFDAVTAETQTKGRGSLGRSFESPEGGLYMSVLLPFSEDLAVSAAKAVRESINRTLGILCDYKPLNDLYYRGKKVCGVLAQAAPSLDNVPKLAVCGIGIDLFEPEEPFSCETAGSLLGPEASQEKRAALTALLADNIVEDLRIAFG